MPRTPLLYPLSCCSPLPAPFPSVFAYTIDNANSTWTEHVQPQYVQSGEETRIYFAAINDFEHDHDVGPPSNPYSSDTNSFGNSRFSHPPEAERRKLKRNRDRNYTPCRGCKSKKVRCIPGLTPLDKCVRCQMKALPESECISYNLRSEELAVVSSRGDAGTRGKTSRTTENNLACAYQHETYITPAQAPTTAPVPADDVLPVDTDTALYSPTFTSTSISVGGAPSRGTSPSSGVCAAVEIIESGNDDEMLRAKEGGVVEGATDEYDLEAIAVTVDNGNGCGAVIPLQTQPFSQALPLPRLPQSLCVSNPDYSVMSALTACLAEDETALVNVDENAIHSTPMALAYTLHDSFTRYDPYASAYHGDTYTTLYAAPAPTPASTILYPHCPGPPPLEPELHIPAPTPTRPDEYTFAYANTHHANAMPPATPASASGMCSGFWHQQAPDGGSEPYGLPSCNENRDSHSGHLPRVPLSVQARPHWYTRHDPIPRVHSPSSESRFRHRGIRNVNIDVTANGSAEGPVRSRAAKDLAQDGFDDTNAFRPLI